MYGSIDSRGSRGRLHCHAIRGYSAVVLSLHQCNIGIPNRRCGYTINFSTQFGAATIRERRLYSGVYIFRSVRVRDEKKFSENVNNYRYY